MIRMGTVFLMAGALPGAAHAAEDGFAGGLAYAASDPVTFVAFLCMVAFLLIAARMGAFRTILGGLDNRAGAIRKELDDAASLRERAAEALALAERRAQDADKEAEAIIEQARRDAKAMLEEARTELAEKIARREAQASARIARAEAEAASEVRRAAADAATEASRRILLAGAGDEIFDSAIKDVKKALS